MPLISSKNESVLVRDLSRDSLLAFNTLYREYSGRLYRFALGYLKSEEEAEELVQEVFMVIWERRRELRADLSFRSFLFTISFNIIRKHFRTQAHLSTYFTNVPDQESESNTSDQVVYDSLLDHIRKLIDQLPEKRKIIFLKSRFEGYSIRQIAEEMNISHKTVENQISEALRFLRKHLNSEALPLLLLWFLFIS